MGRSSRKPFAGANRDKPSLVGQSLLIAGYNALTTSNHANSPETGFWDVWVCGTFHLDV